MRGFPAGESTAQFSDTNNYGEELKKLREHLPHLRQRLNSKNLFAVKAKKRVEVFPDKESNHSKHRDPAVSDFGFTVALHLIQGAPVRKSSRIKVTNGVQGTGEAPSELFFVWFPAIEAVDLAAATRL